MTGWEDGLLKLMREPPSDRIKQAILDIMRSSADDRSAALTVAALADTGIMVGIVAVLRPNDINSLFWNKNAKHNTFDKRITKAGSLGLIGTETSKNLKVIRLVRNAFAHSMTEVAFTTPEIEAACALLTLSKNAQFFCDREDEHRTRYRYCYACNTIFRGLLGYAVARWITHSPAGRPTQPILP
jgi:hypothetical protein